jgi:3D (Asp-Asp-Asp) domain-containing protein
MRAAALALAAWIVAGCTWAALNIGGDYHVAAAAISTDTRAASAARGGLAGRYENAGVARTAANGFRITVVDGGWPTQLEVQSGTVADLLGSWPYRLGPFDRVQAALDAPLVPGMIFRIVRGTERLVTVREPLPAQTLVEPDADLLIGESRVVAGGRDGIVDRTYRVRAEDGAIVRRDVVAEDVLRLAVPERVAMGTHPFTLDTPVGRVSYVRALNVLATYYTPANGGKAPDSPAYGITATGARATRGIVAVDPRVIPLYSWLYIPGYGIAQARDVGSAIIGNHVDVAFDDGDGAWWGRRYLTVYVLAP